MTGGTGADNPGGFRPEIQALRAFAVMVVVLNHLWPGRLTGGFVGVDVFFVISGYLISAHLLREVERTGRIRLGGFWARRARRLLPASLLVLAVAAGGVLIWVPMGQWQLALGQIAASALYVLNWLLLAQSTDYFTSASSPSPVTHYWSLSVEEQFYLAWPLLILVAWFLARRLVTRGRVLVITLLGVVAVASFAYSVYLTGTEPSAAYFSTLSRTWEFGLGGILAVVFAERSLRGHLADWASWIGWAALAASVIVINDSDPFPGVLALVPTLATVLIIAAGSSSGGANLNRVSGFAPIQFLGGISYSLYLWHWPLIILLPYVIGRDIGDVWRIGILAASIALAWMTKRWVEDPARRTRLLVGRPAWITFAATGVGMAIILGMTIPPIAAVDSRRGAASAELSSLAMDPTECFGARAANNDCADSHVLAYPDALLFTNEAQGGAVPGVPEECSTIDEATGLRECVFGSPQPDAERTVAVVGDSHALHYVAALRKLAADAGWRVKMVIRTGCMPIAYDQAVVPLWAPNTAAECREWARAAVEHVAADPDVDMVVFSSLSREYGYLDGTPPAEQDISSAYEGTWAPWIAAGKQVLVLADTAFLQKGDVLSCIARSRGAVDPCTNRADVVLAKPDPMVVAAEALDSRDVGVFDPNDYLCTSDGVCHAVVGGIPAYVDHNHLLQAFAMTLADPIAAAADQLEAAR